jgi:hypothetical protein
VEVDGPAHFTNSLPHSLLGSSLAKQRCLQARGWAVLSVPYYTWSSWAQQQQQQQQQFEVGPQRAPGAGSVVMPNTGKAMSAAASSRSRSVQSRPVPSSSSSSSSLSMGDAVTTEHLRHAAGSDEEGAGAAVLQARAQWLAAALDEAVAMADVPKGMPHLRQLIEDAVV